MADSVVEQLIVAGEFRKAADLISKKGLHAETDQVLWAWAALELGDTTEALRKANELLARRLSADDRARCLSVIGRAQSNQGKTSDGMICLKKALAVASSSFAQAEVLAHYVAAALSWIGVEPALAELPKLRRISLESANIPALVEYHIVHGRIAALKGWWHKVESELNAASGLLESHPHLRLQWRLEQVQASVAIKVGDLAAAITHAQRCLALSETSGSRSHRASTFANLAHIHSVAGDYEQARRCLSQ